MDAELKELIEREAKTIIKDSMVYDPDSKEYKDAVKNAVSITKAAVELEKIEKEHEVEMTKIAANKEKDVEIEAMKSKNGIVASLISSSGLIACKLIDMVISRKQNLFIHEEMTRAYEFERNDTLTTSVGKSLSGSIFRIALRK